MQIVKIDIQKEYNFKGNGEAIGYIHDNDKELGPYNQDLPCLITVPGGAYEFCSHREGEPIAIEFYNRHYNTFELKYDCAPSEYPLALTQLSCLIDYIRKNADTYHINPNKIYVVGFSAGGHLVANLANNYHNMPLYLIDNKKLDNKPNGVILSYPVITPDSHRYSFQCLLGKQYNEENCQALSLDKTVSKLNPPTFIWTTSTDACVNPKATILYTKALHENGIKFESHIFPVGPHGLATADERTSIDENYKVKKAHMWMELADDFLRSL